MQFGSLTQPKTKIRTTSTCSSPNPTVLPQTGDTLYRKTNLIFNDDTSTFLPVTKGTTYRTFLDDDIIKMWDHCKALRPKPRAFICVVGNQEKAKCRKMKEYFAQKPGKNTSQVHIFQLVYLINKRQKNTAFYGVLPANITIESSVPENI